MKVFPIAEQEKRLQAAYNRLSSLAKQGISDGVIDLLAEHFAVLDEATSENMDLLRDYAKALKTLCYIEVLPRLLHDLETTQLAEC